MALKDGRLLEGPPGRGPFAGLEQGSKASQRAQTRPFCPKWQGTARLRKSTLRHTLTPWQWRTEGCSDGRQVVAHLPPLKEQGSKASQRAQKRRFCHAEAAGPGHCGADRSCPSCRLWNANRTSFNGQPKGSKTFVLPLQGRSRLRLRHALTAWQWRTESCSEGRQVVAHLLALKRL